MRLTKHERLAKGLQALFSNLDEHYRKTALSFDVVKFHFYEKKLIANRPFRPLENHSLAKQYN